MIKVLLADDNHLILERFVHMIDWKRAGFEVVSACPDGKKALAAFEEFQPELVITDIQMPKMTGIELAQAITESHPETIILFLTSYEEFSYVKSALELGVYGYLLKHETKQQQLSETLEKIKLEIRRRKLHTKYTAEAPFHSLINDLDDDQVSEEALYEYEISLPDQYDMLLLEQDHIHPVMGELFSCRTPAVPEKPLLKYCYRSVPHLTAMIPVGDFRYLLLIKSRDSVSETAYDLKKELTREFSTSFSVLIIADHAPILTCAQQYIRSREVIRQKFFYPKSSVAHAGYLHSPKPDVKPCTFDEIGQLIKSGQFDKVVYRMDQDFMLAIETKDVDRFDRLTRYFVSVLFAYHNKAVDFRTGMAFTAYDESSQNNWYDANAIYQWLKHKFVDLSRFLSDAAFFQYSDVVRQIIEYVNGHYTNSDLSVDLIAEHLGLNPNRLNTRFKKETGETVWKFIIKVRMDKARELLNSGDNKVTDICQAAGYKNISYFSKVFKETYGMTPLEYRRTHHEI